MGRGLVVALTWFALSALAGCVFAALGADWMVWAQASAVIGLSTLGGYLGGMAVIDSLRNTTQSDLDLIAKEINGEH